MNNQMARAFAPAEAQYREEVKQATWGHLAPKKGRKYSGYVVFALGCLGDDELNPTILALELKGLDSSPWLYDELIDFLSEDQHRCEAGNVYRFDGYCTNYKFKGEITKVYGANDAKETEGIREVRSADEKAGEGSTE